MSLTKYKKKRDFSQSPEPKGGTPESQQLRFVVQKHDASHLHYDFRLEMEGVLKSWAVPKGPSLDPSVKRLAMMVEDHPYDYRDFEGIIPSGYGAGTVIVWDEGYYEPAGENSEKLTDKKSKDSFLRKHLHTGSLKFALHGKKLKGEFALVKTKGRGENSWLLIKHRDKFATDKDILKKEKSVVSGKTLLQVEKSSDHFFRSNRVKKSEFINAKKKIVNGRKRSPEKSAGKKKEETTENDDVETNLIENAPKRKIPSSVKPMLSTLVDKPFDKEGWIYEIKWDGYRARGFS
jgi:bifunctional non-homologous end joining protein LigD